jgi:hypothetical protein
MVYHGTPQFPRLQASAYVKTSRPLPRYNCVAWAVGDTSKWWWPHPYDRHCYWPPGFLREETVPIFVDVFRTFRYVPCSLPTPEVSFEKVALFTDAGGVPTHAARQLISGVWSSKLGEGHDIAHHSLSDLEGGIYGWPALFLRRPRLSSFLLTEGRTVS